jgi:hypothetical protein
MIRKKWKIGLGTESKSGKRRLWRGGNQVLAKKESINPKLKN